VVVADPPAVPAPAPEPDLPTEVPHEVPAAPAVTDADGADELEVLTAHWDGILELLKQGSRRHHAMIEPAIPVAAGRGIVTLRYGQRHASFHAAQARTGELDKALREAILQACGMKVRIDISIEGDDDRRRPMPPSVTPDDARTPVLGDGPRPLSSPPASSTPAPPTEPDEGAEVREAEHGGETPVVDVDALLASELDAHLVEEHGPPEDER
jgi:DNA polymerase III subunit gamma/tau